MFALEISLKQVKDDHSKNHKWQWQCPKCKIWISKEVKKCAICYEKKKKKKNYKELAKDYRKLRKIGKAKKIVKTLCKDGKYRIYHYY